MPCKALHKYVRSLRFISCVRSWPSPVSYYTGPDVLLFCFGYPPIPVMSETQALKSSLVSECIYWLTDHWFATITCCMLLPLPSTVPISDGHHFLPVLSCRRAGVLEELKLRWALWSSWDAEVTVRGMKSVWLAGNPALFDSVLYFSTRVLEQCCPIGFQDCSAELSVFLSSSLLPMSP